MALPANIRFREWSLKIDKTSGKLYSYAIVAECPEDILAEVAHHRFQ